MKLVKILLFLIIVSLPCLAEDLVGPLTRIGQDAFKPVVDSLRSYYMAQQTKYNRSVGADRYRWEMVDPQSYPKWCTDINLIPKKVNSTVLTKKGVMILWYKDILGSMHVMVAATSWLNRKGPPTSKTYKIWYFMEGPGHQWVVERNPIRTVANRGPDGTYCDCDWTATKRGD